MTTNEAPQRSAADWLTAFAARVGSEAPDQATIDTLLDLAGVAAHASERIAAPIACWMAGRVGLSPIDALAIAEEI